MSDQESESEIGEEALSEEALSEQVSAEVLSNSVSDESGTMATTSTKIPAPAFGGEKSFEQYMMEVEAWE